MGQQHRVRTKRKRRRAYLKRKRKAMRSKQRGGPKLRARKEVAKAE